MLDLWCLALLRSKVRLQGPVEKLKQDFETHLCDGRVITTFAQLVSYECMLRPRELVEAKHHAGASQLLADQVASSVWNVRVLDAKDHSHFAFDLAEPVNGVLAIFWCFWRRVGALVGTECSTVDVCCEVIDGGAYTGIKLPLSQTPRRRREREEQARELTAARRARWPPRHIPVVPIRPVHVGRLSR
jgi:hypothetical protein